MSREYRPSGYSVRTRPGNRGHTAGQSETWSVAVNLEDTALIRLSLDFQHKATTGQLLDCPAALHADSNLDTGKLRHNLIGRISFKTGTSRYRGIETARNVVGPTVHCGCITTCQIFSAATH